MPDLNTNYTITQTGGANVEEAFKAINSNITQSQSSVSSLIQATKELSNTQQRMIASLPDKGEGLYPAYRENITSIASLQSRLMSLQGTFTRMQIGSAQWLDLQGKIKGVQFQLNEATRSVGGFNMVGTNTARLFSDMGYFAQSTSFGIMAVGNNISPLIESFQQARLSGQSFKDILLSTFTGTSGILVGINIAVSAITAWSIWNQKSKVAVDEHKKSVDQLKSSMGSIIEIQSQFKDIIYGIPGEDLDKVIAGLEKKIKSLTETSFMGSHAFSFAIRNDKESIENAKKINNEAFLNSKSTSERIKKNEALAEVLKGQLTVYKAQKDAAEILESLGIKSQLKNPPKDKAIPIKDKAIPITADFFDIVNANFDDYIKDLQKKNLEAAQKDVEENLAGMIETANARKKYFEDIETFRVQGIHNSFDREIALARKNADEQSNIYTKLLLKSQISYREFVNIKDLIEQEFERKRTQAEMQRYNLMLSEVGSIGNALQSAFSKSGDDLIGKLNQALQIALQIAKAINAQENGTGSTLGLIASIIPGVGFLDNLFGAQVSSPTSTGTQIHNYEINIGGQKLGRLVLEGNIIASQLRYN